MTALERAVAAEIQKHLPDAWEVTIAADDAGVVIWARGAAQGGPITVREPVCEHDEILSVWCQRVTRRLLHIVVS